MEDSYLYNWEVSVNDFFVWVVEACGLDKTDEQYAILTKMVKTQNDIDKFVSVYDGDLDLTNTLNKLLLEEAV